MLKDFFTTLVDLIYPPNCLSCKTHLSARSPKEILCPQCLKNIQYNLPPFCPKCSRPLLISKDQARCRNCLKNDLQFDFAWGACLYDGVLKDLIHKFKYQQKTLLRYLFADLISNFINKYNLDINQFNFIIPVPLYHANLRERGYNQAELLAIEIAERFKIELSTHNLVKVKPTRNQVDLNQKERWTNVQGAFTIKKPFELENKSILIIDDLLTTGATSSEIALELRKVNVKTIGVLTLAIA